MGRRGDVEHRTNETLIKSQVNISGGAGLQVCGETRSRCGGSGKQRLHVCLKGKLPEI